MTGYIYMVRKRVGDGFVANNQGIDRFMKLTIEELMKENGISNAEQRLGDWCVWYRGKMFVGKTLRGAIEEARQSKDKVLKQELDGLLEEYKINSNDDTFNKIWKWVISIKK